MNTTTSNNVSTTIDTDLPNIGTRAGYPRTLRKFDKSHRGAADDVFVGEPEKRRALDV